MKRINNLNPVDKIVVAYFLIISILALIFNSNLENWWIYVIVHFGGILLIFLINSEKFKHNRIAKVINDFYIIPAFIFIYNEIGTLHVLLFQNRFDYLIISLEEKIFGMHPAIEFAEWINNVYISELLHLGYISYFLLILVLPLILYLHDKKYEFRISLFGITFTFFICYLIFIIFPVAGPRVTFSEVYGPDSVPSFIARAVVFFIFDRLEIDAGAFPSSHVAVAIVILLFARKYEKKVFYVFIPFVILLIFGTVYGRFHYAVDSIAGLIFGFITFYASQKVFAFLMRNREN